MHVACKDAGRRCDQRRRGAAIQRRCAAGGSAVRDVAGLGDLRDQWGGWSMFQGPGSLRLSKCTIETNNPRYGSGRASTDLVHWCGIQLRPGHAPLQTRGLAKAFAGHQRNAGHADARHDARRRGEGAREAGTQTTTAEEAEPGGTGSIASSASRRDRQQRTGGRNCRGCYSTFFGTGATPCLMVVTGIGFFSVTMNCTRRFV